MLTWFYFSESQLERIKPFLFFVSMADASSTVSYTSSSTDFSGRMHLMNTAPTKRVQSLCQVEQDRCFQ